MGAYYCAICKQTTFSGGKKHIFGKSHQSRLRVVLLKFTEKVKEARRTLRKPQVEKFDCTQHKLTFWCYCCGAEVEKHVTDDNMTVMYGGLIEHMATQHKKNTHKFWWENKADPKIRDKVLITEEEAERFKAEVEKVLESFVEKEDEHIKEQADFIRAQEKHRQEVFQSLLERNEELEVSNGPSSSSSLSADISARCQFQSEGSDQPVRSVFVDSVVEVPQAAVGQELTFIGYQDSSTCGNVHTGAFPPWLQDDPLEGSSEAAPQAEIGPSLQEFLKQKEQEKLRKLPPNRVGANFDHSSHTDANWLPSFGRVWNSGRRWQSRHQFRQEEGQKKKQKRKREQHGAEASKKTKLNEQPTNSDM
ncbi:centrosomal AT-AC splicing factor isoform X2 [Austrofundulus limnaeus]|uniref:Centrosomal AT-AC splicing factor isoform X2 n=1 Tax=Austrofundulus limnaeus TaxID=52670 RepID=A0A2I4BHG2_AUSLI|nr:PREDICTED: coiled-coil domain-containing protein 84 isoform X2 [Austrofundulus limnaeus]